MAEKRDWNVGLNAKGLEKSVSEEQARRICTTQGAHSMFIIDAHHGPFVTHEDGSIKMHLIIDGAELIPVEHEDRVRTFMRALYLARPDQFGQEAFEEASPGDVPLDSAAAGLDALVEKDPESGEPLGIWDGSNEPSPEEDPAAEPNVVAFSGKGQ